VGPVHPSGSRDARADALRRALKTTCEISLFEKSLASQFANEKRTAVLRPCCVDSAGLSGTA
jgi:hypothetical protein